MWSNGPNKIKSGVKVLFSRVLFVLGVIALMVAGGCSGNSSQTDNEDDGVVTEMEIPSEQ
jgi:hypothetical protein